MSDAEELARKERRRRLIERLNDTEKFIGPQSRMRRAVLFWGIAIGGLLLLGGGLFLGVFFGFLG